jgi:Flp pilus assembly protein TadB/Mg-chelatase subunit ChlD
MSTRARLVAVGIAGIFVLSTASAAQAAPSGESPTGHISGMQITSGHAQFVLSIQNLPTGTHLDPKSIRVTAAGRTLPATAQLNTSRPSGSAAPAQAAMLVLDTSGSMAGAGLAGAKQAATGYARKLPADVRVGLVIFATTPTLVLAPTTDRAALTAALAQVHAGGSTALYDGVSTAVHAMAGLPADTVRRLVILSDGDDTASHLALPAVLRLLTQAHVPADVVAFRLPGNDQNVQHQIGAASGGRVLPASSAAELAAAFAVAADTFTDSASVRVDVPANLAGTQAVISVSAAAGKYPISTTTTVKFAGVAPTAAPSPAEAPPAAAAEPAIHSNASMMWLVLALTFCGLLSVLLLAFWRPNRTRTVSDRIAAMQRYRLLGASETEAKEVARDSVLTNAALAAVDRVVRACGMRDRVNASLERAGVRMRPQEWVLLLISIGVVLTTALVFLTGSLFLAVPIGAVLTWLGGRFYLTVKSSRRAAAFAEQLPDVLQIVASSLRSGFTLSQALDSVVREGTEPASSEFARALTEARLGADLEDALDAVAERMRCRDLSWVVEAVRISREVGGNLAEVLLTTVSTMRERAQMRRQVRTLSAEGRLSAWILVCLPIMIGGWLLLVRRDYLRPLFSTPIGIAMLAGAGLLVGVGAFWMSRLVKVEV